MGSLARDIVVFHLCPPSSALFVNNSGSFGGCQPATLQKYDSWGTSLVSVIDSNNKKCEAVLQMAKNDTKNEYLVLEKCGLMNCNGCKSERSSAQAICHGMLYMLEGEPMIDIRWFFLALGNVRWRNPNPERLTPWLDAALYGYIGLLDS